MKLWFLVTSCYGFYNKITEKTHARTKLNGITHCTWLATSEAASFEVEVDDRNMPKSDECLKGFLFYSSNHQTPLLGIMEQYCTDTEFEWIVNGNRVFYQFYHSNPLASDELSLEFIPKGKKVAGNFVH